MIKDEIIQQGREQMRLVPTLPQYKTYVTAVKNEDFNPMANQYNREIDSFTLFFFVRFRQVTIHVTENLRTREFQDWEFDGFVQGRNNDEMEAQLNRLRPSAFSSFANKG
jgi:hypothetical protein